MATIKKPKQVGPPDDETLEGEAPMPRRSGAMQAQQDTMLGKLGKQTGKNPKLNKLANRLASRLKKAAPQ